MAYQGPVPKGGNEKVFRDTGKLVAGDQTKSSQSNITPSAEVNKNASYYLVNSRGGSGGGRTGSSTASNAISQEQKRAAEKLIEQQRQSQINSARVKYNENLRLAKTQQERFNALRDFKSQVAVSNVNAGAKRVDSGVITAYSGYGQDINKSNTSDYIQDKAQSNTVVANNQGYSVAPSKQKDFISKRNSNNKTIGLNNPIIGYDYEYGTIGSVNGQPNNISSFGSSLSNISAQKEKEESFSKYYLKDIGAAIASPFVSAGKLSYNVIQKSPIGKLSNPLNSFFINKKTKDFTNEINSQTPTLSDTFNTALLPLAISYPFFAKTLAGGAIGYSSVKTIADPTKENIAMTAAGFTLLVAPKVAVKSVDLARTINLKEVPVSEIVAPEYFAGQKYPQITKGQTAGQLLNEFRPTLSGETKAGGFTASPNPLKGNISGAGSSELPGLYQAPKLSATFLRVSGESKGPANSLLPTMRPSVFRVTPESIELLPNIKPGQSNILSIAESKKVFLKYAELGKSYIPFLKTEKEAVIPAGTTLIKTGKRFYFKFEGRRIPIYEYKTVYGSNKINSETVSTSELGSMSYSGRINNRAISYSSFSLTKNPVYSSSASYYNPSKSYSTYSSLASPSYNKINSYGSSKGSSKVIPYPSGSLSISYPKPSPSFSSSRYGPNAYKGSSVRRFSLASYPKGTSRLNIKSSSRYKRANTIPAFSVQVRRFGKFKTIGRTSSLSKAFNLGKSKVSNTLAASFKVSGSGSLPSAIPGFYRSRKEKGVYIENRKYRLSRTPEKVEINYYKKRGKR